VFGECGVEHHPASAGAVVPDLLRILADVPIERAGARLYGVRGLAALLDPSSTIGAVAATYLGISARPVRALLFDKSAASNWALGWHQDRTIAVASRHDTEGFGRWTVKAGMHPVEPPPVLQSAMVTLRVHLDAVDDSNAPLLVAPGSHRLGRIRQSDVAAIAQRCGTLRCTAEVGDIWAYATLILHASEAAALPRRRRILQIDYAASELPGRLRWLGI
jgi:Phytanoyl-CoA dioxygenase (PhyH)